jgi:nicotinamide N-methyltransferase
MNSSFSTVDRKHYDEQGYLIIRNAFSKQRIKSLIDAVERLIDRALAGQATIPWIGDPKNRTPDRLFGLLNPERYDEAYALWLDEDLLPLIESLLQSPVRHSLFGMLTGGGGKPYTQAWHHDIGTPDELHPALIYEREPFFFTQFNAPLKPHDRFLQIIPASHNRLATQSEIEVYQKYPQGKNRRITIAENESNKENPNGDMPGQMIVELEPGDIAFYNANLWHRGWNLEGQMRWTMHAAYWRANFPVMAHEEGQYEGKKMLTPEYLRRLSPRTRGTMQSYLNAYPSGKLLPMLDTINKYQAENKLI